MKKWLLLAGAIVSEVTASLALQAAQDHPAWYVVVGVGYVAAFSLLGLVLRQGMALGVAYGIWGRWVWR
ncbi:SMR family transporter [Arthrobacter ulcerisalmonis]